MKKMNLMKRILAGAMVAVTMVASAKSAAVVSDGRGAVVEAAGRPVSITSCTIQGDNVVVNVSCSSVPSSSDGKFYLYADEVYQDGCVGKIVAETAAGNSATFTFPLNHYTAESNLSKKFLVAVKSGSMVQVSDEHYITNPEAKATKTVARNDHGMKGILPNSADAATFKDLGVAQMVYNLYMGDIVGPGDGSNVIPFSYNGVDYQFNGAALAQYDGFVRWCHANNFQLTMTILNNKTAAGADLIGDEGFIVNEAPSDDDLAKLKELAAQLA